MVSDEMIALRGAMTFVKMIPQVHSLNVKVSTADVEHSFNINYHYEIRMAQQQMHTKGVMLLGSTPITVAEISGT